MLYVVTFNLFVYSCNVTCNWSCDTSGRCCEGGIPYFGSLTLELTQAWQMRLRSAPERSTSCDHPFAHIVQNSAFLAL